jgi:hypothetical protein
MFLLGRGIQEYSKFLEKFMIHLYLVGPTQVPDIQNLWKDISKQNDIRNQRKIGRRNIYIQKRMGDMTDLIFGIRQLIEKNWEYGKESMTVFINHKKVFDAPEEDRIKLYATK